MLQAGYLSSNIHRRGPNICGWFGSMQSNSRKRYLAGRHIDGAVKIMDLLRDELPTEAIDRYEDLYEE